LLLRCRFVDLVSDRLQPLDLALIDRQLQRVGVRRSAVPVLDAGLRPPWLAGQHLAQRTAALLRSAFAFFDHQQLPVGMRVPVRSAAGGKLETRRADGLRVDRRRRPADEVALLGRGAGDPDQHTRADDRCHRCDSRHEFSLALAVYSRVTMWVLIILGLLLAPQAPAAAPGAMLFAETCAACHGADAKGDNGPNLTTLWASGATDERIFDTIKRGVPGSVMPSSRASDADIRAIVAYLKSLAPPAAADGARATAERPQRVTLITKSGDAIRGERRNEDAFSIQIA